ncbi:MAG TPA: hypothetical protein VK932_11730, partial [Kofleriaceae bacterium]|nr:hypothetical protein [Kofleriaceae bacterium]
MSDDGLAELGKELPWDRPDPARRDAVRSELLVAAAERDPRPRMRWYVIGGAFAAGALAAAAAVLLLVQADERPVPIESAARLETAPAALVDRHLTRTPTGVDEVIRVRAGTVRLSVGALRAGDHVRVATSDAEVEGEGRYEVAVTGDQLREVHVEEGRATIRITGQQAVFLGTGESWRAKTIVAHVDLPVPAPAPAPLLAPGPDQTPAAVPGPAPVPAPAPPPAAAPDPGPQPPPEPSIDVAPPEPAPEAAAPEPAEIPRTPTRVEQRFQSGMALLKSNRAAEAARELGAAADAGGDDPLAADARYFQAV